MTSTIGDRIRAVRSKSCLSPDRFARSLGFTRRSLPKWEAAIAEPPMAIFKPLKTLYNADSERVAMSTDLKPTIDFPTTDEPCRPNPWPAGGAANDEGTRAQKAAARRTR